MKLIRLTGIIIGFSSALLLGGCAGQKQTAATSASGSAQSTPATAITPAEHAEITGSWNYTMTNPEEGTLTGIITIQRGANTSYTGHITTNEMNLDSEMSITKAQLNGSNFNYEGEVITAEGNIPFTMAGTIKGDTMEGENNVQYKNRNLIFKVKATRK